MGAAAKYPPTDRPGRILPTVDCSGPQTGVDYAETSVPDPRRSVVDFRVPKADCLLTVGFRFRRRIRVLPGISLNVGKSGFTSLSAGIRGFTLNFGRKGTRTTTSLPGTGLSYQSPVHHYETSQRSAIPSSGARRGSGAWLIVVVVLLLLWGVVWFVGKL